MKKVIPQNSVLVPDQAELKFQGTIFDVYQWPQKLFDGSEHTFEMLKRTDTVNAICIVDDKILVLDDEQPHLGSRKSFPGGRIDEEDGDALAAAKREVEEETGYSFNEWRLIKVYQPYRKMEWFVNVFLAWDAAGQKPANPDPGEKFTVHELSFSEVQDLVQQRAGYLAESADIFENLSGIEDLLALPEYQGEEVDR